MNIAFLYVDTFPILFLLSLRQVTYIENMEPEMFVNMEGTAVISWSKHETSVHRKEKSRINLLYREQLSQNDSLEYCHK